MSYRAQSLQIKVLSGPLRDRLEVDGRDTLPMLAAAAFPVVLLAFQRNTAPAAPKAPPTTKAPQGPVLRHTSAGFEVLEGGKSTKVPITLKGEKKPAAPITFRKDATFVVWDERGLTIRAGKRTLTTRFDGYGTTTKLFTKEEIRANLAAYKAGTRKKGADEMAGAVRLGSSVYLLPRWNAKKGPWLEALVKIDLDAELPKPILLGKFRGFTPIASELEENALRTVDGRILTVTQNDESWGVAAYAPVAKQFGYVPLGTGLLWLASDTFAERTAYGTIIAGQVDRRGLRRTIRLECSSPNLTRGGDPRLVFFPAPRDPNTVILSDLMSGAQLQLPGPIVATVVPGSGGTRFIAMDAWSPKRAWLLRAGSEWTILARWTSGSASG